MLDPQVRRKPIDSAAAYAHSRARSSSSSIFPPPSPTMSAPHGLPPHHHHNQQQRHSRHPQYAQQYQHQNHNQNHYHNQHHPSIQYADRSATMNTFSTTSTGSGPLPPGGVVASYHHHDAAIRRSSSSRSADTSQPAGYVAALRRQKGTVWCDRAQPEDPALAAQLRAAKMRATRTMASGGSDTSRLGAGHRGNSGRTGTGISTTGKVAAKIRHHGKPGVVGYAPGENHVGVGGVPPRLSATEVEGESSDDEDRHHQHHRRTGSSGRSSTGSGRRPIPHRASGPPGSQRGTPSRQGSLAESIAERPTGPLVVVGAPSEDAAPREAGRAGSVRSGSSAEKGDLVAELERDPRVASKSRLAADSAVKGGGLERRGSVDERTMTLSAGRLFIANPD